MSEAENTADQRIKLISSDQVEITCGKARSSATWQNSTDILDRAVAERSMLIKNMIEDLGNPGAEPIPIMNVCTALIHSLSQADWAGHRKHTAQGFDVV